MQLLKFDPGAQRLWRPTDEIVTLYCTPYTPEALCEQMALPSMVESYDNFIAYWDEYLLTSIFEVQYLNAIP